MKILLAYLLVIVIWSSTPIAIQFSQTGLDFFTSVSLRMWISACLSLILVWIMRQKLALSARALQSYFAGSVGIYGAMMSVYWGAHYIPSGLISVIYGLAPMLTGALAYVWLRERELTPIRVLALLIALSGLTLVVSGRLMLDGLAWRGIVGSLLSVIFFVVSAVWTKQTNAQLHPMVQTSGTLWMSSLMYLLTVPIFGIHFPEVWSPVALFSLSYLILFGSLLAFVLYFYILKHLPTSRVTLITLIAPVLAVMWGYLLRDERLQLSSAVGAALLLSALCLYQWHRGPDRALKSLFNGSLTKAIQKTLDKTS
jgi:drug/metabolite transporter (DMT)-like permease